MDGRGETTHPRPAAVLWDMDGTIVDTEPYWIECEHEMVAGFGGHWDDSKAHSLVGKDLRDAARILQRDGGVPLEVDDIVNRLLDGVIERVRGHVPWRPGARELLATLRRAGIPNALVTMSWRRFADAVVAALPEGTFDVVISGDDVRHGKPHPEPYLAAADALGVLATDCVAIEDSPTGVRSAVAAGCRTIAVPNVVPIPPSDRFERVASLTDLDLATFGLPRRRRRRRRWIPLLIGAAACGVATFVVVSHDSKPLPPLADIPVAVWTPYWVAPAAQATVEAVGRGVFDEVSPFWFEARGETDVGVSPHADAGAIATLLDAIRATGAKVVPSVADVTTSGTMAAILADPARRARHVATLVGLAAGFDGLDIDYERFGLADSRSTWETTSPNWIAFLTELAAGLHAEGKLLSVAVPPIYDTGRNGDSGAWVYDYAAMGGIVDRIRIMAYDYSWDEPGPIAPVEWVRTAVRAAKKAVGDDTRLVLGIPLYGRNWVTSTRGTCPEGTPGRADPNLREVAALVTQYGATPTFDEATGESRFTYQRPSADGACTQNRVVRFVDAQGARARLDIAREERIGGVAFWAAGFETPDVWAVVGSVARRAATSSTGR